MNISLGAQRVMTLRRKKDGTSHAHPSVVENDEEGSQGQDHVPGAVREHQRVALPHNSMFILGPKTNEAWTHAVRTDKRPSSTKSPEENAYGGERISLTFRHIGTFLTKDQTRIWGQGATRKTVEEAKPVVSGGPEAEGLIVAFGRENHMSEFDWEQYYGAGFDVLNFVTPSIV